VGVKGMGSWAIWGVISSGLLVVGSCVAGIGVEAGVESADRSVEMTDAGVVITDSGRGAFGVMMTGVMETGGVIGSGLLVIGSGGVAVVPVESSMRALETA